MLRCISCSTGAIARSMAHETNENFKANDMRIYRFLQESEFQVDDKLWRCHIRIVFDALLMRGLIKRDDQILIRVDFTSSADNFLILSACIDFNGRSVPIFFSIRNYPKRSGKMNQKKMEAAFLKALRHALSKRYRYIIVADRGFGNQRFAALCRKLGFDYVLRVNDNLKLILNDQECNLKDFDKQVFDFSAKVITWKENYRFIGCKKGKDHWTLMTSLSDEREIIHNFYQQRFSIEKCFQDQKSSCFNLEKTKNMIDLNVCII